MCSGACAIYGGCSGAGCCTGIGGGYCSECVGTAACNPTLCGSCITGTIAAPVECLVPGSDTGICGNPCITPCLIPNSNIPDQLASQTSPCLPCSTPDSPNQCGTTDQAPYCNPDACVTRSPLGGGSGAGSAPSSGGGKSGGGGASACTSKLSQALNRFGATLASLFTGGKRVPAGTASPGQNALPSKSVMSSNTFFVVIVVVSILLLAIAFGHAPEGD